MRLGTFSKKKKQNSPVFAENNPVTRRKKRKGDRNRHRITVMLIPHSDKKTLNFQVSLFTLAFGALFVGALFSGFTVFALKYSEKRAEAVLATRDLVDTEQNLRSIRSEVKELLYSAGHFSQSLDSTISSLHIDGRDSEFISGSQGDLSSFFDIEESDSRTLSEVNDLKRLQTILDESSTALDSIQKIFSKQTHLLTEIPSLWPVKGGYGYVSSSFGPNINPFHKNWYMHRGIDIASTSSVPLLSTASGKVIETGYQPSGYGYYVEISHRYGFYTKYGHLQRIYVTEGQDLSQGDVIGIMGNTGRSTGRHVHYEVSIGTQLVDPSVFLDMGFNQRKTFDSITQDLVGFDNEQ